jgi:hypothetical protein
MLLITGSKYLEYISSITIMHNDNNNQTKSILNEKQQKTQLGVWYTVHRRNDLYNDWTIFLIKLKRRYPGLIRDALCTQGTYCAKLRGITLIESTQIKWFSKWSDGEGWSLLSEAKSLKTTSKKAIRLESTQIRWFSWYPCKRLVYVTGGWLKGYTLWGCSSESWKTTVDSQEI